MEADLYEKREQGEVACYLCNHYCEIKPNAYGRCKVRHNNNGILESMVYGKLIAINVDPIEKKPLYHFAPGSLTYSIATVGCNLKCDFCQNVEISQMPRSSGKISGAHYNPQDVVDNAIEAECQSIAYTYTEPTIYFEFAYDTAVLAHKNGLKNVFVSNGYMTLEAIDKIAPYMDAINVDLKSFNDVFYREYCGADLDPVKKNLVYLKKKGIFVEVTTLLIPGANDSVEEIKEMANFIVEELGPQTPWHVSRFHPAHNMEDVSPTPVNVLTQAHDIGKQAGLKHVYIGNLRGHAGENTYCSRCGAVVIGRAGFFNVNMEGLKDGKCVKCQTPVPGVDM